MTTRRSTPAEHPDVPPPTGDAVPITTEPDRSAESPGRHDAEHPRGVYADAERADVAEDEAEAARRHQR
jgi:hypothetical protein